MKSFRWKLCPNRLVQVQSVMHGEWIKKKPIINIWWKNNDTRMEEKKCVATKKGSSQYTAEKRSTTTIKKKKLNWTREEMWMRKKRIYIRVTSWTAFKFLNRWWIIQKQTLNMKFKWNSTKHETIYYFD